MEFTFIGTFGVIPVIVLAVTFNGSGIMAKIRGYSFVSIVALIALDVFAITIANGVGP